MNSNGLISEQGMFSDLKEKDGYVSRLNISTIQNLPQVIWDHSTGNDQSRSTNSMKDRVEEKEEEIAVHSKPKGVYRFYIKAVGGLLCLIYLVLAIVYSFLYNFPRKSLSVLNMFMPC